MEIPINYLAVLVAAISTMVVGFLWYGPLFGKQWSLLMGWGEMTPEKLAEKQKAARPAYAITFIGALLMAYALAHALIFGMAYTQIDGLAGGLVGAFWYWLGFIVPVTVGTVLWDGKPWRLWFINVGYYFVVMMVMGAILGLWV
jgi:hypothetical protein